MGKSGTSCVCISMQLEIYCKDKRESAVILLYVQFTLAWKYQKFENKFSEHIYFRFYIFKMIDFNFLIILK